MFGVRASELLKEVAKPDALPVYNVRPRASLSMQLLRVLCATCPVCIPPLQDEAVRSILEETQALSEEVVRTLRWVSGCSDKCRRVVLHSAQTYGGVGCCPVAQRSASWWYRRSWCAVGSCDSQFKH